MGKHPKKGTPKWAQHIFKQFLTKDFEFQTDTYETMIQLAIIKLMLNKIK